MLTFYFIPDSLVNYVRFLIVISSVYVYFLILAELIVATLAQCMVDKKGNIEANLLASIHSCNQNLMQEYVKLFKRTRTENSTRVRFSGLVT